MYDADIMIADYLRSWHYLYESYLSSVAGIKSVRDAQYIASHTLDFLGICRYCCDVLCFLSTIICYPVLIVSGKKHNLAYLGRQMLQS